MQHGLTDRVRFDNERPPTGPDHSLTFTCEVISELLNLTFILWVNLTYGFLLEDGIKVSEGHGTNKVDAQEQAAKNFATAWRDGVL